jgi:dihydropteroate synthase
VLLLSGDATAFAALDGVRGRRPAGTESIAAAIREALRVHAEPPDRLRLREGTLRLDATVVMGILNVTPDSFSDGGRFFGRRAAIAHALQMAEEGAGILDVGGESTRPGASPVPLREEIRRVLPVVEAVVPALRRLGPRRPLLSIDTTRAEVARRALEAGADLINDISGMTFDPAMPAIVGEAGAPVVLQHIRGTPRTMQRAPRYRALVADVARVLRARVAAARTAGVRDDRIVIDPGIGFGKRRADNLALLRFLPVLRSLGRPILVGASRKSFIGGALELPVDQRLEGSLAAEALAIVGGAAIIRAHDVREAVRVARLCDAALRRRPPAGNRERGYRKRWR